MKNTIEEGQRQDCRMTGWWLPGSVPAFAALRLGGPFPPFCFVDGKGGQSRKAAKKTTMTRFVPFAPQRLCAKTTCRVSGRMGVGSREEPTLYGKGVLQQ